MVNVPDNARPGVLKGLMLLAWANIRRERLRTLLLLVTIALATLLFITSLGSLAGIQAPVEAMLARQNASHALINFDSRVYRPAEIVEWWRSQEAVESLTPLLPSLITAGRPVFKGQPFGDSLRLTERPGKEMSQDKLAFIEGEPGTHPAPGEIWLPSSTAKSGGIHVGDILEIATDQGARPFTVSGIVVDPHYSSGFVNPTRAWIAPGELAAIYTPRLLHAYTLGVRVQDTDELEAIWKTFSSGFEGGFAGGFISYQETVDSYANFIRLLAIMILVFGILSLLVALFIISSTISGVILANYRTFGVLKSMGYTPRNVSTIFQIQFLILSLLAVPVGIAGGYVATRFLIGQMLQTIGEVEADLSFGVPALTTLVIMVTLVAAAAAIAGGRAGRIRAASSIRFGAPAQNVVRSNPVNLTLARHFPLPLVIGLKNVFSGGRRVIYDLITVTVTAFVLLFSINVFHSMNETGKNLPFWGMDGSDVSVKIKANDFTMRYGPMKEYMADLPGVEALAGLTITGDVVVPAVDGRAAMSLNGHVIDGDPDAMGFINLEGRNPREAGEISLGINLVKDYGLETGGQVNLDVRGQLQTFLVTGIFQGSSNGGYWYRMHMNSVLESDPNFQPDTIGLVLVDGFDRNSLMDELEAQLGEAVDVEPAEQFVEAQLNQIVSGVGLVVTFLSVVFLVVSAVSIFNSTAMGIHETKRQLGIYNALGYTRMQIRLMLVNKSAMVGLMAVVLGFTMYWLLAQPIMSGLTAGMGMPEFPMFVNVLLTILAIPVIIAVCMLSAWLPSNSVSKIKARTLIVE
jgi:putative ABC transport system permease protein